MAIPRYEEITLTTKNLYYISLNYRFAAKRAIMAYNSLSKIRNFDISENVYNVENEYHFHKMNVGYNIDCDFHNKM